MATIKRGDIVLFRGTPFYCQPFGDRCNLYDKEIWIGMPEFARLSISIHSVSLAPKSAVVIHVPTKREAEIDAEFERMSALMPLGQSSESDESSESLGIPDSPSESQSTSSDDD